MEKARWRLDLDGYAKRMYKSLAEDQTKRLISYAENEIKTIGDSIPLNEKTGNLLDSLCWGVYYNTNLAKMGYYRPETAIEDSYLHEFSAAPQGVNGHFLAQNFLTTYKPSITTGWEVVWGILAPYWAYWEAGHRNVILGDTFVQFRVMAESYDKIKSTMNGARVEFEINVPMY